MGDRPEGLKAWSRAAVADVVTTRGFSVGKIKRRDYAEAGRFPIVDQGKNQVAGYADDEAAVYDGELPVVVFGDHTRAMKFVDFPFVCGADGTKVLVPQRDLVEPRFLYYALLNVNLPSRGYNRHFSLLREQEIPLPPIEQQAVIAEALRRAETAALASADAAAKTKEFRRSLLRHVFTYGPVAVSACDSVDLQESPAGRHPTGWDVQTLGEMVELIQYGTSERSDSDMEHGVPVLGIPDVVKGKIDMSRLRYLERSRASLDKLMLVPGDVLFVRTNATRGNIGRSAMYQGTPDECLFASYLIRVRVRSDVLLPEYLHLYAWSPRGESFLSGRATEAADGKFNVNSQTLKSVVVPVPSPGVQQAIVQMFRIVDAKIEAAECRRDALSRAFRALLREMLEGSRLPAGGSDG